MAEEKYDARIQRETAKPFEESQAAETGQVKAESTEHYEVLDEAVRSDSRFEQRHPRDKDSDMLLDNSEITGRPDDVTVTNKDELLGPSDPGDKPKTIENEPPLESAKDKVFINPFSQKQG